MRNNLHKPALLLTVPFFNAKPSPKKAYVPTPQRLFQLPQHKLNTLTNPTNYEKTKLPPLKAIQADVNHHQLFFNFYLMH
uniref:hypothetical protein n=1 Tax=Pedobacter schmidteae TaxID=2201271 RepID=UPI000EB3A573|nr:hypothetical protein [Pedobacter schmidteae]